MRAMMWESGCIESRHRARPIIISLLRQFSGSCLQANVQLSLLRLLPVVLALVAVVLGYYNKVPYFRKLPCLAIKDPGYMRRFLS